MASIAIIGTGYVGLTSGACFARLGHDVICADIDEKKIAQLKRGEIPIVEKGLEALVVEGIKSGKLQFVLGAAKAARAAEFSYLCVPTPQGEDGSADLQYLEAAANEIKEVLPKGAIVVNKSTVPVGSTKVVAEVLQRDDVAVVSNPEFLREGSAVDDFFAPDRIVIGSTNDEASIRVAALYAKVTAPVILTDPLSAETIKYASNAFLATKLSYVNAISGLCELVGADVYDVVQGMGYDKRIGQNYFSPGPGWGGSCFPKDTKALKQIAQNAGMEFGLLDEVVGINVDQFERTAKKVIASHQESEGHVAVLGLTFKAGTDDLRDSPALEVVRRVIDAGIKVRAYDPAAKSSALAAILPDNQIELSADAYSAADGASTLVVLTEWEEFTMLDFDKLAELMTGRTIVDTRNVIEPEIVRRRGFKYRGIAS